MMKVLRSYFVDVCLDATDEVFFRLQFDCFYATNEDCYVARVRC